MSEPTTYTLPAEPKGPVWDKGGGRWDISPVQGMWCGPGGLRLAWIVLLWNHGPLTDAPAPEWPTAPHVWWDERVWERYDEWGYQVTGDYWHESHLASLDDATREKARRFAREAVPVTIIPAAKWAILRRRVEDEGVVWDAAEALVDATERLGTGR